MLNIIKLNFKRNKCNLSNILIQYNHFSLVANVGYELHS